MVINNAENFEELSKMAADRMIEVIQKNPKANLCLASGRSPELTYRLFVDEVKARKLDIRHVIFTKLDEWCGFSAEHESSCERYLQDCIIKPLSVSSDRYISFQPDATDYNQDIRRIARLLQDHPIDICILGFGRNGHLGLNEPGERLQLHTHIACLASDTKMHPMLKSNNVEYGMTLGLGDIFAAREVLFLVTGSGKQKVHEQWMEQKIWTQLPASLLWLHPNTVAIVDQSSF